MKWLSSSEPGNAPGKRWLSLEGIVVNLRILWIYLPSGEFVTQVRKSNPAWGITLQEAMDRSSRIASIFPDYHAAPAARALPCGNDKVTIRQPKSQLNQGSV
tara:strand:- start:4159 stop:4464 length:306 start_codon:yes stop_codon:yes gene_type:complete